MDVFVSFTELRVQSDAFTGQTSSLWMAWTHAKVPQISKTKVMGSLTEAKTDGKRGRRMDDNDSAGICIDAP